MPTEMIIILQVKKSKHFAIVFRLEVTFFFGSERRRVFICDQRSRKFLQKGTDMWRQQMININRQCNGRPVQQKLLHQST